MTKRVMTRFEMLGEYSISQQLDALVKQDQYWRASWRNYVQQQIGTDDWSSPAYSQNSQQLFDQWLRLVGHAADDPFLDNKTQSVAKPLIQQYIDEIAASPDDSYGSTKYNAWLLVQHMDDDVEFQRWFLQHLDPNSKTPADGPNGSNPYQMLHDRVNVNTGQPQQFNTQMSVG
jgi:hypothetical protein